VTIELQNALAKYIDKERVERQRESECHLREIMCESKQRSYAQQIAEADARSGKFLEKLLTR
jgi:hypothetical protein